jgi:hypothetical protein
MDQRNKDRAALIARSKANAAMAREADKADKEGVTGEIGTYWADLYEYTRTGKWGN